MRDCLTAVRWVWRALRVSGLPAPVALGLRVILLGVRHGWSMYVLAALWKDLAPDEAALTDDRRQWSWRELVLDVDALATVLDGMGLRRRDRIGLMCRNHGGFVIALLASMRLGADVVLLSTRFDGRQLAAALDGHDVCTLVVDPEYEAHVKEAGFRGRVLWSEASADREVGDAGPNLPGLIASTPPVRLGRRRPGALIVLTSGTTGAAKGVRRALSVKQVAGIVYSLVSRLSLRTGARTLIAVPLFHGYGIAALALGLALRCPVALTRHTDGSRLWAIARRTQATNVVVVPTLLRRMLDASLHDPPAAIERIVSGSAPMPTRLIEETSGRWGEVLYNLYGSTEAGLITIADPRDLRDAPDSVGYAVHGTEVVIRGNAGDTLGPGKIGEVVVTGPLVFDGYDHARVPPVSVHTFATGDKGWRDDAGRLHLLGRMDDMLIVGGENIYPQQVEDRLMTLRQVVDVAVAGLAAEDGGQRIVAWFVLRPGHEIGASDIASVLPAYMRPTRWTVVEALPRNAIGKLARGRLAPGTIDTGSGP
ncbi:class I adenylate-forming enzyme family protein [Burkholderia lata]|uniref:AMP-dependent synthetase and ligase n=1 Tax=Burkholderia lata (strain ATCC 17760 / DSM 23089 / LMG 22485 / NCIMB 9086 / R18194 / 383) TaxID=482957 RepID=Q39NM2_BURL3|nr:AMP-binding protein [Burkholderia lata]ABB05944.1 AMP-dependent synthetase and ligase [Burkholderia lata]